MSDPNGGAGRRPQSIDTQTANGRHVDAPRRTPRSSASRQPGFYSENNMQRNGAQNDRNPGTPQTPRTPRTRRTRQDEISEVVENEYQMTTSRGTRHRQQSNTPEPSNAPQSSNAQTWNWPQQMDRTDQQTQESGSQVSPQQPNAQPSASSSGASSQQPNVEQPNPPPSASSSRAGSQPPNVQQPNPQPSASSSRASSQQPNVQQPNPQPSASSSRASSQQQPNPQPSASSSRASSQQPNPDDSDDEPPDEDTCPICLRTMIGADGSTMHWRLHHNHAFHMQCILTHVGTSSWAQVNRTNDIAGIPSVRCPVCRASCDCLQAPCYIHSANSANSRLEFFCQVIKFLVRKARDELNVNTAVASEYRLQRIAQLLLGALGQLDRFLERNNLGERRGEIMSLTNFWTRNTYSEIVEGFLSNDHPRFERSRELLLQFCDNFGVSRPPSPIGTQRSPSSTSTQRSPRVRFADEAYPSPIYPSDLGIGAGRTHQGYEFNNKYYVIPRQPDDPLKELLWYRKVGVGYQLILLTPRGGNQIPIISTAPSSQYGGRNLINDFSSWCFRQNRSAEFQVERNTASLGHVDQLKILNYWFIARDETQAQRSTNWPVQYVQVHFGPHDIRWSPTAGQTFLLSTLNRNYARSAPAFDNILNDFMSRHSIPRAPPPRMRRSESPRSRSSQSSVDPATLARQLDEALGRIETLEEELGYRQGTRL